MDLFELQQRAVRVLTAEPEIGVDDRYRLPDEAATLLTDLAKALAAATDRSERASIQDLVDAIQDRQTTLAKTPPTDLPGPT